ncbi:hypothetical protein BHV26_08005 [Campylobacter coli]|nr:hypothetical protein [Campylobacter coli]
MTSNSYSQSSNYKIFLPFLGDEWIYAQNIALPGFSLNPSQANFGGKTIYVGGDHIDYDPVTVGFLVGEDFKIYTKLIKYIFDRVHPNNGNIEPLKEFTCGVEITDNKGESLVNMTMYGCKITNLGALQLISNADDAEQTFDLTFNFDNFELIDYFESIKLKEAVIKS